MELAYWTEMNWPDIGFLQFLKQLKMNGLFKGLLAGGAAAKWGGGCFGTVIVFILVWWLLGHF